MITVNILVGIYIRTTGCPSNKPGSAGVFNRNLADYPTNKGRLGYTIGAWLTIPMSQGPHKEPELVGVYNRNLADHPTNQGRLGYTIGTWLTTQRTRAGWGIQ